MTTADALMMVYYVVLSGALVFTLGYLAEWRSRQEEAIMAQICTRISVSYRGHKNSGSGSVVKLLMRDEVIAVNIAKLTELLARLEPESP